MDAYDRLELLGRGAMGDVWLARRKHGGASPHTSTASSSTTAAANTGGNADNDAAAANNDDADANKNNKPNKPNIVDVVNNEFVALKQIEKARLDARGVAAVFREKAALQKVQHPLVVRLRDTLQTKTHVVLVLSAVCGGDLQLHLRALHRRCGRGFSISVARFYTSELVLAITALHSNGIVHGDVKAKNVVLSARGRWRCSFSFSSFLQFALKCSSSFVEREGEERDADRVWLVAGSATCFSLRVASKCSFLFSLNETPHKLRDQLMQILPLFS
jgi:serine/threonine protein kinase